MEIKLSVVIITFNEEKNIGRCLDSVRNVADEIIVVDSYSVDRTKEICMEQNVIFFEHEFEGYSHQKNYALSKATCDAILSLDADEALSPELEKSIEEVKKNPKSDGYELNRLTNYQGKWIKHCGWYPDRKLRLVKMNSAEWIGDYLHEKLELINNNEVELLKGDLYHYSYENLEDYASRTNKYSSIAAQDAFDHKVEFSHIKLILSPLFTFIKKFFFQLGFLDGYNGFLISRMTAYGNFMKYSKLKELYNNSK
jgi:glycosyltransferase involved in cell wall biosynthesis